MYIALYATIAYTYELISPWNNNSRLHLVIMRIRVAKSTNICRAIRRMLLCARRKTWVLFAKVVPRRLHCVKRIELPDERRENEMRAMRARRACVAPCSYEPRKNASIVFPRDPQPTNSATARATSVKVTYVILGNLIQFNFL